MIDHERKALEKVKAICALAASNFPAGTDITISAAGTSNGSIVIPSYVLQALVETALAQTDD